ncbi:MAG: hypothetical protein ACKOB5_03430 [Betaproteobacteria bacterium]
MPKLIKVVIATLIAASALATAQMYQLRVFAEERREHAVADAVGLYREAGMAELIGESLECYTRAVDAKVSDRVRSLMIERCIAIDWVGNQIENAVAAGLDVEPAEYFAPGTARARVERLAQEAGIDQKDLTELIGEIERLVPISVELWTTQDPK